jgi:hypothetical protein
MPSLNLRSNGPVAKYLGFIVGEPTYKPSNFCALFWMLIFSPVIFVFLRIIDAWCFFKAKIDTALENSFNRQAAMLAIRYEAYPDEALIDWYQHYSRYRYDIRERDKVRSSRLVEAAFQILGKQFEETWWLEILIKIGAVKEASEGVVANRYFELVKSKPRSNSLRTAWSYWQWPLAFLGPFCFLPVVVSGPEGVLFICAIWGLGTLTATFVRLELHIVVYNVYRAIKDRTCPLIIWS